MNRRWPVALVAILASSCAAHVRHDAPTPVHPVTMRAAAPSTPSRRLAALPNAPTGPAHPPPATPPRASPPVHLRIPAIGVDTELEALGLLPDGALEAPHEWGEAGWYADGVRPGDPGPAVIAGHVDSIHGPAVFYRLPALRQGAAVLVRRADGSTLRFVVDSARSYPKTAFPTAAVYGPTPLPELRLVTCTGEFDRAAHSYLDNLVVSAHLA